MAGIQPDDNGGKAPSADGESSTYSSLGTKGDKPGAGGSDFSASGSVKSTWASLGGASPEVRSGFEFPSTASDGHN